MWTPQTRAAILFRWQVLMILSSQQMLATKYVSGLNWREVESIPGTRNQNSAWVIFVSQVGMTCQVSEASLPPESYCDEYY